jgi:hypothetical protein
MTTGYLVNINAGTSADASYNDLSYIFKALVTGTTPAQATGFTNSAGKDLNTIFNPLSSTTTIGYNTNMISLTGQDLSQVFDPFTTTPPTPTTLSYTVTDATYYESFNTNTSYRGVVFYIPYGITPTNGQMTGTITFNQNVAANVIVVGGGAGGGTRNTLNNRWYGGGGGGGACITSPVSFTGNTSYSFAVGQGGLGGGTSDTVSIQSSGNNSYFLNGAVYYNANGGNVTAPDTLTGVVYSIGGSVNVSNNSSPIGLTGGGGGGGGGEIGYVGSWTYAAGGTGGSWNSINPGVAGSSAVASYKGGTGGNSYFKTVSSPFLDGSTTTPVGGGGAGGSYVDSPLTSGTAGLGSGGFPYYTTKYNGWGCNANNNSYTQYTLSSGAYGVVGPTGPAYGYGAGGGATYNTSGDGTYFTGGNGGNGVVMIYWDNTLYPSS